MFRMMLLMFKTGVRVHAAQVGIMKDKNNIV